MMAWVLLPWTRPRTVSALLLLLAVFGPVSPAHAFTAKLNAPWAPESIGDRGGSSEEGLQIVTDGEGDSAGGRSKSGRRRRRRSRSSSKSSRAREASADEVEDVERDAEPAEIEAPSREERWIDVNVNGWPNQSSTLRAYHEYVAAASHAGMAMSYSSSPSLTLGGSTRASSLSVPSRGGSTRPKGSTRTLGRRGASATGMTSTGNDKNEDKSKSPKVKDCLSPLLSMTRPDNFPGVLILHILGAYKALNQALVHGAAPLSGILAGAAGQSALKTMTLKQILSRVLREPRMMVTVVALLLTTATSMLVNDYYDARSGVDLANVKSHASLDPKHSTDEAVSAKRKPLATGAVPLPVAKRFLYYLYASLLLSVPFVPGTPAQLSVILGAMLTFLYTQHLKPVTWLKNALCAGLIAFSPLTSGMAAAYLVSPPGTLAVHGIRPAVTSLYRLVLTLFAGFMSREMLMDITDVEGDKLAGIQTVPVRHGLRYASRAAFVSVIFMAVLAVAGPSSRLVSAMCSAAMTAGGGGDLITIISAVASALLESGVDLLRLGLASLASGLMVRGAWVVCKSDGRDLAAAESAVEEGKLSILPLLASFI